MSRELHIHVEPPSPPMNLSVIVADNGSDTGLGVHPCSLAVASPHT